MRYSGLKLAILWLSLVLLGNDIKAQLLAFPTAEGAGKFVSGGRGSSSVAPRIYEVTTLVDDATSANTAGTLRYACTNNSPSTPNRIIVFRVSGTIHLYTTLNLNRANTTIAGQTAPGEGICIADYPVTVAADNMIIRYIRFRLGDKNQAASLGGGDAFSDNGNGRKKIIVDHCTMSWSNDEAFTFYEGDSITLQWNMISEPLDFSFHDEGAGVQNHSYGGIWGGTHATFHHNLFAHARGRMPRFDGIRNIPADSGDFRNNVMYNWIDYNTNGGEGGAYNIVNNYYKYGPSTLTSNTAGVNRRNMLINPYRQTSPAIPYGKYYLTGNYCDNSTTVTANNWLGAAFNSGSLNDSTNSKVITPFNALPVATQTAQEAYQSVLAGAGCVLPRRDTLDQRIVNDVINRTGRIIDVQGGYPRGTAYNVSQTAWPALASGTVPLDTDHDGMPDVWETKRGLNPNNAADANGYISTSGYSNIENYLNGDSLVATGIVNNCVTAKKFSATNSGSWRHALDTIHSYYLSASYTAATDSMNAVASVLDNGSFGDFTVSYYTTNTLRYDAYNHPYLNRNITVVPDNAANITAPVTVRFYFTRAEYDALKAADNTITSVSDLRIIKVPSNTCLTAMTGNISVIVPSASGVFGTYSNGYYLEFATLSFSTFFITSVSSAGTLPLRLLSFNATYNGTKTSLVWKTTNEINTDRFEVERSADGISFSSIGTVTAKGGADINQYSLVDATRISSVAYYRLKMIDKDSKFIYSKVVRLTTSSKDIVTVYPNPARASITVSHPVSDGVSYLEIYTANGAFIKRIKTEEGVMQSEIKLTDMSAGSYHLIYKTKTTSLKAAFIKTN